MDLNLQEKIVMVTGSSSGIGRATAVAFGAEKARVVVTYVRNEAGANATAKEVDTRGGRSLVVQLDLGDPDSINATVTRVAEEWGGVDVLVNNAVDWPGYPAPGEQFETAPVERFRRSLRANLEGPYLLSQSAVRHMRDRGWGRIVHVSTGLVEDGFPGSSAYIAAKAGLHGLGRVMSRELASAGILTNVVLPGFTPGEKSVPDAVLDAVTSAAATNRVTDPTDVANAIVFLCSAANTNITGEMVRVDGHFYATTSGPSRTEGRNS